MGIAVLVALAGLAVLGAWLLPRRLLDPLSHLRAQFSDVGAGRFEAISLEGVDAALIPLFRNYNTMVRRLAVLEEERRARADTLEAEVRASARALLDQQRALADAERLAAVGQMASGIVHDLKNPLAIMQLSHHMMKQKLAATESLPPPLAKAPEIIDEGLAFPDAVSVLPLDFTN